ncbi:MAG: hypothetical protein OXU81_18125 [Gammaproteobacteria bacterium]|nr:hypothetical protein [Gammaproteobacteria bacterium]
MQRPRSCWPRPTRTEAGRCGITRRSPSTERSRPSSPGASASFFGRGTRLRTDYGKLAFNIIDYTGTATEKFADPDFDGIPLHEQEDVIDREGETVEAPQTREPEPDPYLPFPGPDEILPAGGLDDDDKSLPRKYYVDGGEVEIVKHLVIEISDRFGGVRNMREAVAEMQKRLYGA